MRMDSSSSSSSSGSATATATITSLEKGPEAQYNLRQRSNAAESDSRSDSNPSQINKLLNNNNYYYNNNNNNNNTSTSSISPLTSTQKRTDFYWETTDEPHATRRREMLKKYPQIRDLMRHEPLTKWVVLCEVAVQFWIAYLLRNSSLASPVFWIAAYVIGGTITSSLVLSVHEITHFLAFRSFLPNKILACIANLPIVLPFCVDFKRYHMDHHRFQGVDGIDGDLPTKLEGYLLNNVFGKIFFCSFQILFYAIRPKISATPRTYRIPQTFLEWVFSWYTMNYVIQLSVMAAVMYAWGWSSMAYLVASVLLGGSLHPMAAHFLAEHYVTHPGQETYSYYGWLNNIAFNVGYHNEHHDFPNIPWTLLPQLRVIAPEYYEPLAKCQSWSRMLIDFITMPALGPYSRIKRSENAVAEAKKMVLKASSVKEGQDMGVLAKTVESPVFVGKEDM